MPKAKFGSKNKGTIEELNQAIKDNGTFVKMASYSLACLSKLAVDEVSAEELLDNDAFETVLALIEKHPDNKELQMMFNEFITRLARSEELAQRIGQKMNSKQVKKLVQNLEGYSEDETFATSSLQALNGLCKSRDMCAALVEAGACEAITKVLNAHPSNMALSALAVELADHLAYNEASCARIVDLGGQEILQSLKAHSADAALVYSIGTLMGKLACSSAQNSEALQKMGAASVLMTALLIHPYEKKLNDSGATALKFLTGEDDILRQLKELPLPPDPVVLDLKTSSVMSTISTLLLVKENVQHGIKHAAIPKLAHVLKSSLSDPAPVAANQHNIVMHACRSIGRVAKQASEADIHEMLKNKIVKLLVKVLKVHVGNVGVCEAATGALTALITRPENADFILRSKAFPAVFNAVSTHSRSEYMSGASLRFVEGLIKWPEINIVVGAAGCSNAILKVLQSNWKHHEVPAHCFRVLQKLGATAENLERGMAAKVPHEAIRFIKEIQQGVTSPESVLEALALLSLYAANGEFNEVLKKELEAAGLKAMEAFPGIEVIQKIGLGLVELVKNHAKIELEMKETAQRTAAEQEAQEAKMLEAKKAEEVMYREQQALMAAHAAMVKEQEEADMLQALEAMKEDEAREEAERALQKKREEEQKRKDDAEREQLMKRLHSAQGHSAQASAKPNAFMMAQSNKARALFESETGGPKGKVEFDPEIREFLITGSLLLKHNKIALPKKRHVYLSADNEWLCWKNPKKEAVDESQKMHVFKILTVKAGRCTPNLKRTSFAKSKEENSFAVIGIAAKQAKRQHRQHGQDTEERSIDLEASSPELRKQWVEALEHLIRFVSQEKLGGSTQKMNMNAGEPQMVPNILLH